jgi:hypothetical protein
MITPAAHHPLLREFHRQVHEEGMVSRVPDLATLVKESSN